MAEDCKQCEGCGRVANDDDHTPWTAYENIPLKSAGAILMGLIRPVACPECGGSGKQKETREW